MDIHPLLDIGQTLTEFSEKWGRIIKLAAESDGGPLELYDVVFDGTQLSGLLRTEILAVVVNAMEAIDTNLPCTTEEMRRAAVAEVKTLAANLKEEFPEPEENI